MRLVLLLLLLASRGGLCEAAPPAPRAVARIVSTAPSITETLFGMGLGPRVVGVTIYCDYPAQALALPKIGTLLRPDVEAILALHPDLVVVQKQPNHIGDQLTRLHVPWVEMESHDLEAIYAGARVIGRAAHAQAAAEQLVRSMQAQMSAVARQAAGLPRPRVAFIVGHNPGRLEGLIVGSGTSYFSDLLRVAGGVNIFADAATPYPRVSLEDVLSRNPDVILELSGEEIVKQPEVAALWRRHSTLKAVATGRVYAVPPGPILIPGPRAAEAARLVLHLLHPELKP